MEGMEHRLPRSLAAAFLCSLLVLLAPAELGAQVPRLPQPSGGPSELARLGQTVLFFSSEEGVATMWRSDGTASGTVKVRELEGYSDARIVAQAGEAVFFVTGLATRGESHLILWITDGTEQGTEELAYGSAPYYSSDVRQGIRQPDPGSCRFFVVGESGRYFFVRSQTGLNGSHPRSDLFSYRPNAGPPKLVHEAPGVNHIPLLALDAGRLYFSIENEIWSSDGETATRLLEYYYRPSYLYGARELQVDGRFFHVKADGEHGTELWARRNGADSMVKDISPGVNSSDPACFAQYRGLLLFSASTPDYGRELWVSDGTAEGTRMLLDIEAGKEDSSPDHFIPVDEGLIFITSRSHLWKTDGTTGGTVMLSPSLTWSAEQEEGPPELDGARLFADNPRGSRYGTELYGSEGGRTRLLKDINPGGVGSKPSGFTRVGNAVFFSADDRVHGRELWRTDGTENGTHMVKDINPGGGGTEIGETASFRDRLFFVVAGADGEQHLYLSDGTGDGTVSMAAYSQGSFPRALTPADKALLYLVATYKETERRSDTHVTVEYLTRTELCRSDGTASGTAVLMAWQNTDSDSYELRDPLELEERYYEIP